MDRNTSIALSTAAVIAVCALIFYMSSRTGGDSGALSRSIADFIVQYLIPGYSQMPAIEQATWHDAVHLAVRKLAHFSEFAMLGALAANLAIRLASPRMAKNAVATEHGRGWLRDVRLKLKPRTDSAPPVSPERESDPTSTMLRSCGIAWAFSTAYAASDELHQLFVPGRACLPLDVLIDASGALVGVAVFALGIKLSARLRN